jgi:hypothetical protein
MIQYPKNEHITLPSVEGAFGSLNIMRNPPQSIHTRYVEKVGVNNKMLDWIDGSGDRACEGISKYARGVNPMVSVNYTNQGTSGGQVRYRAGSNANTLSFGNNQAYNPYTVARDGAFRPPITPLDQLLPLSRLPRLPVSMTTNQKIDLNAVANDLSCYAKKTDYKEIRKELLDITVKANSIFNIETPAECLPESKYSIKDALQGEISTNKGREQHILTDNKVPERGVKEDVRTSSLTINPIKRMMASVEGFDNKPLPIKENQLHTSLNINKTSNDQTNYIHSLKELRRNMPMASFTANRGQGFDLNVDVMGRTVKLPERNSRGGFENAGFKQSSFRQDSTVKLPKN